MTLPCIVCDEPLEPVWEDAGNQPHAGTTFKSHGHYGSTFFDPIGDNGSYIEINICDECLRTAQEQGKVDWH